LPVGGGLREIATYFKRDICHNNCTFFFAKIRKKGDVKIKAGERGEGYFLLIDGQSSCRHIFFKKRKKKRVKACALFVRLVGGP